MKKLYYIFSFIFSVFSVMNGFAQDKYSVNIKLADGTPEGVVLSAGHLNDTTHDIDAYENWENGFDANKDEVVYITMNSFDYIVDGVTANGNDVRVEYNNQTSVLAKVTISNNTEIIITAHEPKEISLSLTLSDPDHVIVMACREYSQTGAVEIEDLVVGEQIITFKETCKYILVKEKDGAKITNAVYISNGSPIIVYGDAGDFYFPVEGTMSISVESTSTTATDEITLDIDEDPTELTYFFYVENVNTRTTFFYYYLGETSQIPEPKAGKQTFMINPELHNPIRVSFSKKSDHSGLVFVNDQQIAPRFEGGSSFEFQVYHGDVIKVVLADTENGLHNINKDKKPSDIYNILGVKVTNANTPGIYIIDGKKVIIK